MLSSDDGVKVIYEKNAERRMSMASTTKIMTALVAVERLSPDTEITVGEESVGVEGSSLYFKTGEVLTLRELLYAMLLESANDAAAVIACAVGGGIEGFADMMNEKAEALGLSGTHFENPHGLDAKEHYTTASELAVIAHAALRVPLLAEIFSTFRYSLKADGDSYARLLINHNRILCTYDGAIGVKTGYTKASGRCLVSAAERDGVRLICVTLDDPDDWRDHTALLDYGFSLYESVTLAEPYGISYELPLLGGEQLTVRCSNPHAANVILPREHGELEMRVEINRYLAAPIKKGTAVGMVSWYSDGEKLAETEVTAEYSAALKQSDGGLLSRLRDMILFFK